MPNDSKVQLGTSQDLRVYHTGSLGVIRNDTGTLYIDSNDFEFRSSSGSSAFQKFIKLDADANGDGGVVQLYFDNVLKAQTSSDGFDLPDNSKLQLGDSQDLSIYHDGSHSVINDQGTGTLKILTSTMLLKIELIM